MEACGRTPWSWRRQLSMTICAARSEEKIAPSRSWSRRRALKRSMKPFAHGLPRAMWAVLAPTAAIQSCTALAMNAGAWAERMCRATPRRMNRSASGSMTSMDLSRRETPMARHSWVNSSLMLSMRSLPPSWVIMGALLDEVVGPHVIAVLGPESDAGAAVQPETKPTILRLHVLPVLQVLQPLPLMGFQPAELLAPAVLRHLGHADRADRVGHALALRGQNLNLPQLRDNLFRLVSLPSHLLRPPCCHKAYLRADHSDGGGSDLPKRSRASFVS